MRGKVLRLMGAHEIRARIGSLSRQRVYQLTGRDDFPAPIAELGQGKIWLADDVEAWIATHRTKKPPPKATPRRGSRASGRTQEGRVTGNGQ